MIRPCAQVIREANTSIHGSDSSARICKAYVTETTEKQVRGSGEQENRLAILYRRMPRRHKRIHGSRGTHSMCSSASSTLYSPTAELAQRYSEKLRRAAATGPRPVAGSSYLFLEVSPRLLRSTGICVLRLTPGGLAPSPPPLRPGQLLAPAALPNRSAPADAPASAAVWSVELSMAFSSRFPSSCEGGR